LFLSRVKIDRPWRGILPAQWQRKPAQRSQKNQPY
jgi:hypothetical protein